MSSTVCKPSCRAVDAAAETIVQAFLDDPFNAYFYNLLPDPTKPPRDTTEMMAIHVRNALLTDLVLAVDDEKRKCASVALWQPPKVKPLGWFDWTVKRLY